MKILKVVLLIKNMIALKVKAKAGNKSGNAADISFNEIKHPAEFLLRW